MADYRVAIIGCGRQVRPDGKLRRGISYSHGRAYQEDSRATVVALADIKTENAEALAAEYDFSPTIYADYRELLAAEKIDLLSVCTWPALHCEMTIAAAEAGVKAVHCEKPMAPNWGEAKRMAARCAELGVQLSFNHQRRFGGPFRKAKELLAEGAIGKLRRLEAQCPNLYDWGTHWFDMMFFYNDDQPAEWVLGQFDKRTDRSVFGMPLDDQGTSLIGFSNGVVGYLETGDATSLGASNRLIGESGVIEVGAGNIGCRYWNESSTGWVVPELASGLHGPDAFINALGDVMDAMDEGREPELAARKALQTTEVIFATYESCRRRGRVDLPLDVDDSALVSMLAEGTIGPDAG